jgi:hypothetical protein
MTMTSTTRENSISIPAAILWVSAFLLAALIIVQAGKLPQHSAYAAQSASAGSYTILAADRGTGGDVEPDEVIYVIDNRDQVLLVYDIENIADRRVILRDGGPLDTLFRNARR